MKEIPVVDRKQLQGDLEDRRRAGQQIVDGLRFFGLYYLINHGIATELRDRFFRFLLQYLRLPLQVRQGHILPHSWGQRGWAEGEKAVTEAVGTLDHKGWFFANPVPFTSDREEQRLRRRWPKLFPPNFWPLELPAGFQEALVAYGHALHEANLACQRGCALGLGLPEHTFVGRLTNGPHNTRALAYYPLQEDMIGQSVWGAAHLDFNQETVLGGGVWVTPDGEITTQTPDSGSGLYLQTADGQWVSGQAPPGCITVQCGQQKEILTGGKLRATPHVIRPPAVPGWGRLSVAHFAHEHPDLTLQPLRGFDTEKAMELYGPPRLVGTFDEVTLHQIGLTGLSNEELINRYGYPYGLLRDRLGNGN